MTQLAVFMLLQVAALLLVVALLLRLAPRAACRSLRRYCCGGCPSTYWRHRYGVMCWTSVLCSKSG
jgi:hypothetical protein